MIDFSEATRLARLQERVRRATYHEISKDGHHKSSEGHVSLAFNLPAVVSDDRDPYWSLEVYSYLLCPDARSDTWTGASAAEVIGKAEDAIARWCMTAEMEMFEQSVGGAPDGPEVGAPAEDESAIPF